MTRNVGPTEFIPASDVQRRLVHQDDFEFAVSGAQYHVGARPRKPVAVQLMWGLFPLAIAMGLCWMVDRFAEVEDEHVWFLWAFLVIGVVTGGVLIVALQFVYRSHAKIGKLLVGQNGSIEVSRSGDQVASSDIEALVLLRGTLRMPRTTGHHQSYPICQAIILSRSHDQPILVFTALHHGRSLERALKKFCRHDGIPFRAASAGRDASHQAIPPPGS